MKHKLLITAASLMFAISASAQWTKPTVSFVDMAEDGETTQYLYNVGTGMFFAGHNDYNTRASVAEKGDQIRIKKIEESEEGFYTFGCYPATYVNKNAWLYVSGNDWNAMWVDGTLASENYPGTESWIITKVGDAYKFSNDNINQNYELDPTTATLGVSEIFQRATGDTRCYIYYPHDVTFTVSHPDGDEDVVENPFSGNFYDEWKFVSEEEYANYSAKLETYNAALSLKAAIDDAESKYAGIDLTSPKAVYNNTASTTEELKAAEAEIAGIIVDFQKDLATAENPVDLTAKIINPKFGPEGSTPDFTGWKGTPFGAGGTTWSNAEHYGKTFDSYQDIEGLPAGVYMVACNGYTRYQNAQADFDAWKAGTPAETKIYLSCETNGKFSTPVKHVSEGGSLDAPIGGNGTTTVKYTDEDGIEHTLYCPNLMITANDYFHDGTNRYRNEAYGALAEGETLRIGLINEKATGSDWSIFDDFELYYFGNGEDAYQLWGTRVAELYAIDFNNPYGAQEKARYDVAINALKNSTNKEEIMKAVADFEGIPDLITESFKAYAAYVDKVEWALEQLTELENDGADPELTAELADYLQASASDNDELDYGFPNGCANYIIDLENGALEGRLTTEQITEETAYLDEMVKRIVKEVGSQKGKNVTNLLTNPSFKDGFTGWTTNGIGNVGGKDFFKNVEVYQNVIDCRQTVKDVAPGVYAISVKAFVRPGENGTFDGSEEINNVFLFMNQFSTPIQNISADAMPEEDAKDGENCYVNDGGGGWPNDYNLAGYGWIPNSMDGASYAFNAGRYEQKCYGLVGEDGVMTIGITSNGVNINPSWCLWADFKLTYMAKDEEALQSIIEHYAEQAANIENAGIPDMEALNAAIEKAQNATDGDAMYTALFELIDAYNTALESVKQYETALDAYNNLMNVLTEYEEKATQEAKDNANKMLEDYAEVENYAYAGADLADIVSKLNGAAAKLKLPNIEGASDDTPVDLTGVIVNPTYVDANSDGWQGSVPSHANYNRTDMVEYWHATCNQYQTLYALPAGTYELTVNAYNRYNDNAQTDYDNLSKKDEVQTGQVYVTINGKEVAIPVRMISEGARADWTGLAGSTSTITLADGTQAYTPNNMQGAGACFEDGDPVLDENGDPVIDENGNEVKTPKSDELNYINRIVFELTEDTDVTIGIKNSANNAWMIWDNWKLTYFGTDSKKVPTGDGKPGDVNEDTKVDISDIVAIINQIAGTATYKNADVNGDKKVDISDIVAVINIIAAQ
jgi:uncharacterized Zn-binding protein involved in type VI secretion